MDRTVFGKDEVSVSISMGTCTFRAHQIYISYQRYYVHTYLLYSLT